MRVCAYISICQHDLALQQELVDSHLEVNHEGAARARESTGGYQGIRCRASSVGGVGVQMLRRRRRGIKPQPDPGT